jgi:hypothetical protein
MSDLLELIRELPSDKAEMLWDYVSKPEEPIPTEAHGPKRKTQDNKKNNRKDRHPREKRDPSDQEEKEEEEEPITFSTEAPPEAPSVHSYGVSDPTEVVSKLKEAAQAIAPSDVEHSSELDWIFHAMEAVTIGAYGMWYSESANTFATHFVQMCHSVYGKSLSLSLWEMLGAMGITDQHLDEDKKDPDWIVAARSMLGNWEAFKESPLLSLGLKILGMVVSLGYCSLEDIEPSKDGFRLFSKLVVPEKVDLTDLLSAGTSLFGLVVNQGYECYKHKTFTPLLYSDEKLVPILEKVARCETIHYYFETGDLRSAAIDEKGYAGLLTETMGEIKTLSLALKSSASKKMLSDKLTKLMHFEAILNTRMSTGGLKEQPFTVGIWGGSSVGKSTINNILVPTLLRALRASYKDKDRLKLNPADNFVSGATNAVTAISIDEIGQVKEKFQGEKPIQFTFMQLGNIEATSLNMAEAPLKGKICPHHVVMTTTKNVKDNGARAILNEPIACARREHYILTIVVRDQFATNSFLDSRKIVEYYGRVPVIPDAWKIRIEKVVARAGKPITPSTNILQTEFDYVVVEKDGKVYDDVSIFECLEFLIEEAKEHYEYQKQIVAANKEIGDKLPFCDKHLQLCRTCGCDVPTVAQTPQSSVASPTDSSVSSLTQPSVETKKPSWFSKYFTWPEKKGKEPEVVHSPDKVALQKLFSYGSSDWMTSCDPRKHMRVGQLAGELDLVPKPTTAHLFWSKPKKKSTLLDTIQLVKSGLTQPFWQFLSVYLYSSMWSMLEDDWDKLHKRSQREYWFNLASWLPDKWFYNPIVSHALTSMYERPWLMLFLRLIPWLICGTYFTMCGVGVLTFTMAFVFLYYWDKQFYMQFHDYIIWKILQQQRTKVPKMLAQIREDHSAKFGKAVAVLTLLYTISKVWTYMEFKTPWAKAPTLTQEQGGTQDTSPGAKAPAETSPKQTFGAKVKERLSTLIPKTKEDHQAKNDLAKEENKTAREHNWVTVHHRQLDCCEKARTITPEQLVEKLKKVTYEMTWTCPVKNVECSLLIFMVRSNRGLTVGHFSPPQDVRVNFTKIYGHNSANFSCWIGPKSVEAFGQDSAVVYVPKAGVHEDITDYFTDDLFTGQCAHLVWRKGEQGPTSWKVANTMDPDNPELVYISNAAGNLYCYEYRMPEYAVPGMCGAPFVSHNTSTCILGIHQAGATQPIGGVVPKHGYAVPVKRTELLEALSKLAERWFEPTSAGVMETQIFGKTVINPDETIHPKSPLLTQANGHFEYLGTCPGRATFRSTVHLTPMAREVEKEFNTECKWRAPKMEDPWGTTLGHIFNASDGIEPEHLQWAQDDYFEQMSRIIDEHPEWIEQVRPLTNIEAINGIDGVRFIDAMDLTTASGHAGLKKKDLLIEQVDPETGKKIHIPTKELEERIEYVEDCFRRGVRSYVHFKLVFKDEAVNKEKMRAFSVGPFEFSIVTRKWMGYLHWLFKQSIEYSECCVGMNPHGPEWEEWVRWYTEYSEDLIFAADYKHYDLSQGCMTKGGTAHLNMRMVKKCPNMPPVASLMIRGIFTEKMYPVLRANGDLILVFGYSPSGVSGTVEENGMDNGHIMRAAAHKLNPQTPKFRAVVKMGNYGDDLEGGVHPDHQWFNPPAVAEAVSDWGYVLTPANKDPTFTKKWDPGADFLKMTNGYIEGTDIRVGKLDKNSILKPLLANTKSSLTPEEQCVTVLDGAVREMLPYGREEYEDFRSRAQRVADYHLISPWCTQLEVNYDEARARWAHRYGVELTS